LGRAAAPEHDDAAGDGRGRHVPPPPPGVVGVVVGGAGGAPRKWPTKIRTAPPFFTCSLGAGSCATTTPSSALSVTSREETCGTSPTAVSVSLASLRVCPDRSGTSTFGIALATTIVTLAPGSTLLPAAGSWR